MPLINSLYVRHCSSSVQPSRLISRVRYFRVPEPAGRTFAELDILFERKTSARKFKQTRVDAFEESVQGGAIQVYEEKIHEIDHMQKA